MNANIQQQHNDCESDEALASSSLHVKRSRAYCGNASLPLLFQRPQCGVSSDQGNGSYANFVECCPWAPTAPSTMKSHAKLQATMVSTSTKW